MYPLCSLQYMYLVSHQVRHLLEFGDGAIIHYRGF